MTLLDNLCQLAMLPRAAALGPMLKALAAIERLPAAQIEQLQRARLAELVRHARRTAPHYARLPERFEEIPALTRAAVREHAGDLASRDVPEEHRVTREPHSSGSTGVPVTAKIGAVQDAIIEAVSMRDHGWHGRDLTLTAASIRAVPDGSARAPGGRRDAHWSPHPRSGPLVTLDVHTPVREQLVWLAREAPAYVATYASNTEALVDEAARNGTRLPALRELGTFGEVLPPALRGAARRTFGVPVVDAYSSSEVGFIALQCPEHTHYHVQSESVFVEVVRDDGTPCEIGETGRVLVTPLHAFAMPLIRYDLGDYATRGAPCPTGLGLPVLESIVGRVRNMLQLPGGDRVWPRFGSNALGRVAPVKQFRLVQHSLERVVLELVADRLSPELEARVRKVVLDTLRYPFELELEYKAEIPRSASGKFEDCLSLIGRDQNSQ